MVVPAVRQALVGATEIGVAGVRVRLLAERAMLWPQGRTLFVADVHLGKAETFRALGVPVPRGPTQASLDRLTALLDAGTVGRLVVLGDLLHARQALAGETMSLLRAWRDRHAGLEVVLVRGNHDQSAGDPPARLGIRLVDEPWRCGPFECRHAPGGGPGDGYALAGHLHPVVRLRGRADPSLRIPCFRLGRREGVLPAFGDFTGGVPIARRPGDRVFAIAGAHVVEIPTGGRDSLDAA